MTNSLGFTDYVCTQNFDNKELTPLDFFERVLNIGTGTRYKLIKGENGKNNTLRATGKQRREVGFVVLHVITLIFGSVFTLIALAAREGLRANLPKVTVESEPETNTSKPIRRLDEDTTQSGSFSKEHWEEKLGYDDEVEENPSGGGGAAAVDLRGGGADGVVVGSTMSKKELEIFITSRLQEFETPVQFQARAEKLGERGLCTPQVAYMELRKMTERGCAVSEIIPGLYLSGMPALDVGLTRVFPYNFNEKLAYKLADEPSWKRLVSYENIFAGHQTEEEKLNITEYFSSVPEFDGVLALQGRQKDTFYPGDCYMKKDGELKYFAPSISSPDVGTNLSADEFKNFKQVKEALLFVRQGIDNGKKYLVHCNQGCDRSVALVYGVIRLLTDLPPREIMDFICIQRRIANDYRAADPSNRKITRWFLRPVEVVVKMLKNERLDLVEDPGDDLERDPELAELFQKLQD